MISEASTPGTDDEPIYRVSAVIDALSAFGITPNRNAVIRASEKFVGVSSQKSEHAYRSWTQPEIDKLVVAFRLRHHAGLGWQRIAELLDSGRPLPELLQDELDALAEQAHELAQKHKALSRLHEELAAA